MISSMLLVYCVRILHVISTLISLDGAFLVHLVSLMTQMMIFYCDDVLICGYPDDFYASVYVGSLL